MGTPLNVPSFSPPCFSPRPSGRPLLHSWRDTADEASVSGYCHAISSLRSMTGPRTPAPPASSALPGATGFHKSAHWLSPPPARLCSWLQGDPKSDGRARKIPTYPVHSDGSRSQSAASISFSTFEESTILGTLATLLPIFQYMVTHTAHILRTNDLTTKTNELFKIVIAQRILSPIIRTNYTGPTTETMTNPDTPFLTCPVTYRTSRDHPMIDLFGESCFTLTIQVP